MEPKWQAVRLLSSLNATCGFLLTKIGNTQKQSRMLKQVYHLYFMFWCDFFQFRACAILLN